MRRLLVNKVLYRCNQSKLGENKTILEEPIMAQNKQQGIKIETRHISNLLHPPKTGRQESVKSKMRRQWIICLTLSIFFYMNSEDIIPGSWFTDNLFYDFHDKYPYRIKKQYEKSGKVNKKYMGMVQKEL